MTIVGIDIGKRPHQAAFLHETGERASRPLRFPNTPTGSRRLAARLATLPGPITIGIEATANYWTGMYHRLVADGYAVSVVNPLQAERYRTTALRPTKTDGSDATALADLVRIGRAKASDVPTEADQELRELTRFRRRLIDRVGALKREILLVLDLVFPEFAEQFSDPFGTSARALLAEAATAAQFAALALEPLVAILRQASRGQLGAATATALRTAAADSLGRAHLGTVARLELDHLLAELALVEQHVAATDAVIAERMAAQPSVLQTIPGIGPVLAAILVSEIGPIARFARPAQLVGFAGLDPSVAQSAASTARGRHLSKRGSP
jgi:transposase